MFPQFASRLIRNGATLGGNLGTASPIGDAPPALLALDARLVLASAEDERDVPLTRLLSPVYRQSVRRPRRADQDDPHPAARRPSHPRSTRSPSAVLDDISGVAWRTRCGRPEGTVASIQIGLGGVVGSHAAACPRPPRAALDRASVARGHRGGGGRG